MFGHVSDLEIRFTPHAWPATSPACCSAREASSEDPPARWPLGRMRNTPRPSLFLHQLTSLDKLWSACQRRDVLTMRYCLHHDPSVSREYSHGDETMGFFPFHYNCRQMSSPPPPYLPCLSLFLSPLYAHVGPWCEFVWELLGRHPSHVLG